MGKKYMTVIGKIVISSIDQGDSVVVSVFDAELPGKKDSECFLVRYHLSREDLKKVNYHIYFPPTDAMKDFYMRPSYDEVISRYKGNGADS